MNAVRRTVSRPAHLIAIVVVAALVVAACSNDGADEEPSTTTAPATTTPTLTTIAATETTTTTEAAAAATTVADAAPEVTLEGCETDIGDGVPVFYATYFRCTDISVEGDVVVISSTNLPPHFSYYYGEGDELFEPFDFDRGDQYRPNPNEIAETAFTLRIPLAPVAAGITIDSGTVNLTAGDGTDFRMGPAGVALDGVALFNSLAAPGDDIEDEKYTFDSNEGHPQQQGAYHYHAPALGPLRVLEALGLVTGHVPGETEIELYGVMCDGTVVMGLVELDGSAVGGDLDLQAGHSHDITDAGGNLLLEDRYHIHMAPTIGADPRGLTPEAQYYTTCNVS
jgi:hypothetical protein